MTYTNNEFANIGSTNLDDLLEQINTYKWKLKHKASKNYYDCFNPALYEEDEILEQKTTKCCKTVELFSANSTSDKDHGKQITHDPIKLLNTYFSDIFGHNNTKIVFNTHKYLKIIIPDAIYEDFLAMISQYNLQVSRWGRGLGKCSLQVYWNWYPILPLWHQSGGYEYLSDIDLLCSG